MPSSREPSPDAERTPKRRRARPQLSCTECRRLKMKCDRKIPCAHCRGRGVGRECRRGGPRPSGPIPPTVEDQDLPDQPANPLTPAADVHARLAHLESLLAVNGRASAVPETQSFPTSTSEPRVTSPAALTSRLATLAHASPLDRVHGMPALAAAVDLIGRDEASTAPLSSLRAVRDGAAVAAPDQASPEPVGADDEGIGTLVMFPSGRARFLGRTAASEWLKNQEDAEGAETAPESRAPSPVNDVLTSSTNPILDAHVAFPFNTAAKSFSTAALLAQLPAASDARTLLDVYIRHFDWHFHVVAETKLRDILDRAYRVIDGGIAADHLALLYIVLAVGAAYNLELPPDDSTVHEYLALSQCCLAKADFLNCHTIAAVQTLFIMSHLLMGLDSPRGGDSVWPLFGLVMRIVQAMGLHRDGRRWGLPDTDVEERRTVFWEVYLTDLMMSNNFCRPGSISPDFMDTEHPSISTSSSPHALLHRTKFEMAPLFIDTLNHSMRVRPPPYSNVAVVNDRICAFERTLPFEFRCRPVLVALPSAYADSEEAIRASPPTNKRNLQQTFQQFLLALNLSEALVHLHRPYFARALYESPRDPTRSRFGQSYLAVVERCNAIVIIASSLYNMYPQAAIRHWWIWFHAFCSAACMGTLVLKNPRNVLAEFASTLVDTVVRLHASVAKSHGSERFVKNLNWLVSLRARLDAKVSQAQIQTPDDHDADGDGVGDDDDLELLGWKTRLIERAEQGLMRATTINPSPRDVVSPARAAASLLEVTAPIDLPGEAMLDQFWDSIAAQDGSLTMGDIGSVNWWASGGFGDGEGWAGV